MSTKTIDLPKFKKQRDNARNELNKAINSICAQFGLSRFEVTHSIIDKAFINAESYGTDLRLTPGLAETYFDHTIRVSEAAKGQDSEPAPAKKKAGKFSGLSALLSDELNAPNPLWEAAEASASSIHGDDLYMAAKKAQFAKAYGLKQKYTPIKKVPLEATKNKQDWIGKWTQPSVPVGGTIAKKTVDYYGYKLPPGYVFVPTTWGGEYTVEEEVVQYQLINDAGFAVTVPLGQYLTKGWMVEHGLWDLNLPDGVKWAGPGPEGVNGDSSWALVYAGGSKPLAHAPLEALPADDPEPAVGPAYPIIGHWCGTKGCLDISLNPGQSMTIGGEVLAQKGLTFANLQKWGPSGFTYTNHESMYAVVVKNGE